MISGFCCQERSLGTTDSGRTPTASLSVLGEDLGGFAGNGGLMAISCHSTRSSIRTFSIASPENRVEFDDYGSQSISAMLGPKGWLSGEDCPTVSPRLA